MFQKQTLAFEDTNLLNPLVQDYLQKKKEVQAFYSHYPDTDGYKRSLQDPKLFSSLNRKVLVESLTTQARSVTNTSKESLASIELLDDTNCFTVTTGHQLCLFTGPLYFIYKIISAINLSESLTKNFPDKKFIPVYWMAGEDHDFEEVNHAFVYGKKLSWVTEEKGSVGNFSTQGPNVLIVELKNLLGESDNAKEILALLENSYQHKTLSEATRYLVNALFGKYGLVIADGNDKALKKEFASVLKKDIFDNVPAKKVNETIAQLKSNNYQAQVNPREINCFFVDENGRNRIEKEGDSYKVLGTTKKFSKAELEKIIDSEPWKMSPNVVLRPIYQQYILPNIAYVGGPGEINYWLEYKSAFESLNIHFPMLQLRELIMIIDKNQDQKLNKLGLNTQAIFKPEQELINALISLKGDNVALNEEKRRAEEIYNDLLKKSAGIDKTLEAFVKAELQKTLNSISSIESKLNKSLKQRSETEINQIKNIKAKLFPENIPQERYDNLIAYYTKYGKGFIEAIKKNTEGNDLRYIVLTEV